MSTIDIAIRLVASVIISYIIGFEREKSRSNAGIKTHVLVGVASTIITIIQVKITQEGIDLALAQPELIGVVRSDPARLTAQIVSGIGFLGAGTIIVTKRNISGLTTAASIWAVAALGMAVGFGYYDLAIMGTITIVGLLFVTKHYISVHRSEKVIIKYIKNEEAKKYIEETFEELSITATMEKYDISPFGESLICTSVYVLSSYSENYFSKLVEALSTRKDIVSVQTSNIKMG